MWIILKKLKVVLPRDPVTSQMGIDPKDAVATFYQRHLHIHIYWCSFHKNKEIDAAQLSISKWMSDENIVYIDNGNFSTTKKNEIIKFAKMGGSGKSCIKVGDSITKRQILHVPIICTLSFRSFYVWTRVGRSIKAITRGGER